MKQLKIRTDEAGSSSAEFALIAPILVWMIWGVFQLAMIFEANAGMQQALGEGARYATLWNPSTGAPRTTTEVQAKITSAKFGLGRGTWDTPTIDTSHAAAAQGGYWTITVTYHLPTNFLFFAGRTLTMTQSKRVYLAQ